MTHDLNSENDPQRANAEGRSEEQLSAGTSSPILPQPEDAVTHLYEAEEKAGRAALAGWVFHKQVRPIIESAREGTETFVAAVSHYLDGDHAQLAVTDLACSILNLVSELPNGERRADVLDPATGWAMPPAVRNSLRVDLKAWLIIVAYRLANAGVPLDPDYPGEHLVIAQLLMLDVWGGDYDLLEDLNYTGPTMYHPLGRGTPVIRGRRTDRATLNASRLVEYYSRRVRGERNIASAPYSHAGPRATARQARYKAARLDALRQVAARHPQLSPTDLLKWSTTSPSCPAYQYRSLIAKILGISWDAAKNRKPSLRTLQRDFAELGLPTDGIPRAN